MHTDPEHFLGYARGNDRGTIVVDALVIATNDTIGYILDGDGFRPSLHPAGYTQLLDMNNSGVIVGNTFTERGSRGFIYQDGEFTELLYPGESDTIISAIYDDGDRGNLANHPRCIESLAMQVFSAKRVHHFNVCELVVFDIPRGNRQTVLTRRGGDQAVLDWHRTSPTS